jgi:arsenate reductase
LLKERGIEFDYREYTKNPLSTAEIRQVLEKAGLQPKQVLRKRDAANRKLKLTGDEDPEVLMGAMAEHPTLLQRPIGVLGGKAVLGRPPEALLALVSVD